MTEDVTELERRWVLSAIPNFPTQAEPKFTSIWQDYVPIGDLVARLRRSRDAITHSKKYHLTYKEGAGVARLECENEIPEWMYRSWRTQSIGGLTKTRVKVHTAKTHLPLTLVFDLFTSEGLKGLVMAEVEYVHQPYVGNPACLNTAKIILAQFELPSWAGEAREVTDDPRYNNQNLAIHGLPH